MRNGSTRRGFSLLELIAVITLIGVVAAVTLFRLNSIDRRAASESVMKQNVGLLQNAVERYRFDRNRFPDSLDDLVTDEFLARFPGDTEYFKYRYDATTGLVGYTDK